VINTITLSGKSCTGKDSIAIELEKLGYKRIITYTTRIVRKNEIGDVSYHYISVEEFLRKYIDGFFLEVKYYETKYGLWFYGSALEDYKNADDKTMCILTPSGLQKLYENNINYVGFLIDISDDEIKRRQIKRNDKPEEAERRFEADKLDFVDVDDLVDVIVNNENQEVSAVAKKIDEIYKGWC
jgi:guanylate kinase